MHSLIKSGVYTLVHLHPRMQSFINIVIHSCSHSLMQSFTYVVIHPVSHPHPPIERAIISFCGFGLRSSWSTIFLMGLQVFLAMSEDGIFHDSRWDRIVVLSKSIVNLKTFVNDRGMSTIQRGIMPPTLGFKLHSMLSQRCDNVTMSTP